MRQGIVREALYLPPVDVQRQALAAYGYDDLREEKGSDFVADRRIHRLIADRRPGDEIVVHSLGVLTRPQGRPARTVCNLLEAGLVLTLVSLHQPAVRFTAFGEAMALASALADHERGRNVQPLTSVHQGGSRNHLSKYQIEYARRLYADGKSLRAIGLLFQLSPNHVLEIVTPRAA